MALYLIGTSHVDPKGPQRLERLLNWMNPDIIGVEIDPKKVRDIFRAHSSFEQHASAMYGLIKDKADSDELNAMTCFLYNQGYELWVSHKFIVKNPDAMWRACDDHSSLTNLAQIQAKLFGYELDDPEDKKVLATVRTLRTKWTQEKIDLLYDELREPDESCDLKDFKTFLIDRDDFAAARIRDTMTRSKTNLVYVGGAMHIFGNYYNLYDKLRDLNPIRVKLNEADKFAQ